MSLVEQWDSIVARLDEDWVDARIRLALPDVDAARRGLARVDAERLDGTLVLAASTAAEHAAEPAAATPPPPTEHPTLAAAWERLTATLPPDWSDLYVELVLRSTDYIARASLRMTPLNARREPNRSVLRFRCARIYGYGGSPQMTRRCLERCDEDGIRGELRLLRVLSDTIPVGTQGPVWNIAGRTV